MTKVRLCDNCPILNLDQEDGASCNLRYSVRYVLIRDKIWRTVNIFGDCELEKIVVKGMAIVGETIDIELIDTHRDFGIAERSTNVHRTEKHNRRTTKTV